MSPDQEAHAPPVTTPTEDAEGAVSRLAKALSEEFGFLSGNDDSWTKAAAGVLLKMRAEITSGAGGVVIVTLP